MCKKLILLVIVASLLGPVSGAGAGIVIMQCDVGDCGPLQSGWTSLGSCGTFANVAGTGIGVTLATGIPGACACRDRGGGGPLVDVEADLLFADDENYSPGSDFIITFSNLIPGAKYRLLSYHSRMDEGDTTIPSVTITGATVVSVPTSIVQNHAIMDNPAECIFIAGAGDASIRFQGPDGGCLGCQAFFNGFVLELNAPTITFESDASGGVETISPASIPVNLIDPEPGETYTVQYAATGGTATLGDDYSLTPGTLIFNPGQSTKAISIDVVSDAVPEDDETIILTLSGPTGPNVVLTGDQHTYTISDSPPKVSFQTATSSGLEDATPALVAVKLSHASDQTVTVDYAVTGGTATNGVDYVLAGGTLQFDPLETTEYISIDIVDDSDEEEVETIVLSLSDPCNATLGSITQHTRTILDNEEGLVWDSLIWYYSHNPDNLFVNVDGDLEWIPEKGGQYVTRIPDMPLSGTGDKVELSYWYMSDGKDDCPPDTCYNCIYCDDDITCIAGTSDFRFGLFQADAEYITADGFSVYNSVFTDYKGYNFRFGPHLQPYPVRWVDCTDEVHKTGNFNKKPQSSNNLMTINEGEIRDDEGDIQYIPGFELPPGEWSLLTISLERLSSSDVELSITLNDTTYTCVDDDSDEQPSRIDVFGVHMRNGRPYSRLVLDTLWQPPPEPAGSPSPADDAENVDPNVVLKWKPGQRATSHDVYFGTDSDAVEVADTSSTEYKGRQNLDANSYDPCGLLELATTYYWRIDEVNEPNLSGGQVWHFTVGDGKARDPSPRDGSWCVSTDTTLSWTPGVLATSHDVYFGTNFDNVNDANTTLTLGAYMGNQSLDANTYSTGDLESAQNYYWRIDEVNDGNLRKGDVWSFTVVEYIVVDDFEEYTEGYASEQPGPWEDGSDNDTGSTLYFRSSPYPVRGGEMSMEYWYDNSFDWGAGFYSEAERKYADPCDLGPRDWIASGVKALTLYFYGDPDNDATDLEQMYVGLEDSAGLYAELRYGENEGEDMNDIKIAAWQRWDIPLTYFSDSDFAAVPNDVNLADVNTLFIGFGIRGSDEEGGEGTVYFDDISLYPPRCVPEFGPYADLSGNCIVDFADIGRMADDWFYVGLSAADLYEDNIVNLRDYAVLADGWLKEQLWPPEE